MTFLGRGERLHYPLHQNNKFGNVLKMIGKTYKDYLQETLRIFDEFVHFVDNPAIKSYAPLFFKKYNPEAIKTQANNIKNGKFTLMVVGEAKSGKSTFINAFLKSNILPVDVVQCTSAIIEIDYDQKIELTYTTADDTSITITREDDIFDFLKNHAALKDEYRNIPVSAIDQLIITAHLYGTHRQSERQLANINIDELCKDLADENVSKMPVEQYNSLIRDYVTWRSHKWKEIVTKIVIKYPLPDEMKDIRIIDSPGVNAYGQVGEMTEDFIGKANAVVFMKCLTGEALESKSFLKFIDSKNGGRCKESLFLLLSRASDLSIDELGKLLEQAKGLYKNTIDTNRIIPIDSKVQIYYNLLHEKTDDEIIDILDKDEDEHREFHWITSLWRKYERHRISHEDFDQTMLDTAGFQEIRKQFEIYARKAQKIALFDLIEQIKRYYNSLQRELEHDLELSEKKVTMSPEDFAREIESRTKKLEELKAQMNQGVEEVIENFTRLDGVVDTKKKCIVEQIKKALVHKEFDKLEAEVMSALAPLITYKDTIANEVINECNAKLSVHCSSDEFGELMKEILAPTITPDH